MTMSAKLWKKSIQASTLSKGLPMYVPVLCAYAVSFPLEQIIFPNVSIARDLLYCEEIYLAVPVNHPLAEKEEVCFNDIKNEIFIGYNSSTGIASTIHSAIARKTDSDFRLKTIFSANEPNTITYMVSKGLGIGFVVENPSLYTTPVKVLPITDLSFYHPIYLVWKNTSYMSPAANEFRQFILCNRKLRTSGIRPSF